jgi:putative NADH-flavin reductase
MNQSYNMLESHLFREQNHTMQQLLRKKEKIEKKKKKEIWENTVEELDNKSIIKIREKAISRHVSFQSATHDIEMNGQEALNNIASNSTSLRNIVHHTLSS